MKRSPIKRKTRLESHSPVRKRRSKPRPGRLKDADLKLLRATCFVRDNFTCQYCAAKVDPFLPHLADTSAHMAHIHAKRRGGDSLENVRTLCGKCHRLEHAYGKSGVKPCPAKS